MERKTKIEEFETQDLLLVTYLLVKQFKTIRPPSILHRYVTFYFERTKEIEQAVQDFFNHTALCDPLVLLERYRSVKSQAWDAKKLSHRANEDLEVSHE